MVFKNRYMVMEVFMNPNRDQASGGSIIITQFNVANAIKDSILVNFGECGLAASLGSFQVKYVNPITNVCIIRASREEHEKVWASITMVKSIGNFPVVFNLLDLSEDKCLVVFLAYSTVTALTMSEESREMWKFTHVETHMMFSFKIASPL
ncbi:hypothetical protein RYX36_006794 [Vicia faba]